MLFGICLKVNRTRLPISLSSFLPIQGALWRGPLPPASYTSIAAIQYVQPRWRVQRLNHQAWPVPTRPRIGTAGIGPMIRHLTALIWNCSADFFPIPTPEYANARWARFT